VNNLHPFRPAAWTNFFVQLQADLAARANSVATIRALTLMYVYSAAAARAGSHLDHQFAHEQGMNNARAVALDHPDGTIALRTMLRVARQRSPAGCAVVRHERIAVRALICSCNQLEAAQRAAKEQSNMTMGANFIFFINDLSTVGAEGRAAEAAESIF
jgi:hypothetical protein